MPSRGDRGKTQSLAYAETPKRTFDSWRMSREGKGGEIL